MPYPFLDVDLAGMKVLVQGFREPLKNSCACPCLATAPFMQWVVGDRRYICLGALPHPNRTHVQEVYGKLSQSVYISNKMTSSTQQNLNPPKQQSTLASSRQLESKLK
eukprot:352201-Chlamydomonas_euryale.AAC.5